MTAIVFLTGACIYRSFSWDKAIKTPWIVTLRNHISVKNDEQPIQPVQMIIFRNDIYKTSLKWLDFCDNSRTRRSSRCWNNSPAYQPINTTQTFDIKYYLLPDPPTLTHSQLDWRTRLFTLSGNLGYIAKLWKLIRCLVLHEERNKCQLVTGKVFIWIRKYLNKIM